MIEREKENESYAPIAINLRVVLIPYFLWDPSTKKLFFFGREKLNLGLRKVPNTYLNLLSKMPTGEEKTPHPGVKKTSPSYSYLNLLLKKKFS